MSDTALRCYDYVNQPYPRVRDTLLANPLYVFRHATAAATTHAATLHVHLGAFEIGAEVAIRIVSVEHTTTEKPTTKLTLEWSAAKNPALFPTMEATLAIYALTPTETQLDLEGHYRPPMGKLGAAIDAAVGHRLAKESVTRFIKEVAGWLREELAVPAAPPAAPTTTPTTPIALQDAPAATPLDVDC